MKQDLVSRQQKMITRPSCGYMFHKNPHCEIAHLDLTVFFSFLSFAPEHFFVLDVSVRKEKTL